MQLELQHFAKRLAQFRIAKNLSQSDLARAVWGEMSTTTGRKAARNRDRISSYEKGKGWPDPANLLKIANILGVNPGELISQEIPNNMPELEPAPEMSLPTFSGQ